MKSAVKKVLSLMLMVFVVAGSCFSVAVFAEDEDLFENGNMDLDVVFVLDHSSSMASADPNHIAPDAFNLFVDLVDDSCGAGYVVYNHKIVDSSDVVSFENKNSIDSMKKKISTLGNNPEGDTDIALGITKAKDIFEKREKEEGRKRAVILLSDGNTDLPSGPRTVEESRKEMDETLKALAADEIPVYSIGLNYNGTLDKNECSKIAESTNGKAFEAKNSDELTSILSDIFADIYNIKGTKLEIVDGNVSFKVNNNSVFYLNIIIESKFTLQQLNPVLTMPDGSNLPLDDESVKVTSAGSYTLVKLMYPKAGDWNMHLDNATKDNCKITQLDFYSVVVKQSVSGNIKPGEKLAVSATLNDGRDVITDYDLLATLSMKAYVKEKNAPEAAIMTLEKGKRGVYTGVMQINNPGEYTIYTIAKNDRFEKRSDSVVITVGDGVSDPALVSQTEEPEISEESYGMILTIITYVIIAVVSVVLLIILIFIIRAVIKAKAEKDTVETKPATPPPPPKPEAPRPKPQPQPEPKQKAPEPAKDPEYVDIPLIEHGALEDLIKRGSDDSFNKKAEDFHSDADLEKIVKKGTDDSFNSKAEDYQTDDALEQLVKKGTDDSFNSKADDYHTDVALEQIVKKGSDDAFTRKAEDFQTDDGLESIIKKGSDDAFNSTADQYQSDPSLEAIVKKGEDGLKGKIQPEELENDEEEQ